MSYADAIETCVSVVFLDALTFTISSTVRTLHGFPRAGCCPLPHELSDPKAGEYLERPPGLFNERIDLLSAVEDREPGSIGKQKPVDQRVYERSATSRARFPFGIQACQKVQPRFEFSPLAKLLVRS